jgi:two-component system sensor histidine kinase RegB
MPVGQTVDKSAAAMGLGGTSAPTPWYLGATPLATLPWLIRLRWATAALETIVLIVALLLPQIDFPLRRLAVLVALSTSSNAAVAYWLSRGRALPRAAALITLVVEASLLTGLLDLTGGPFNPFAVLYAVHITLAALTVGRVAAGLMALFVVGCYGVLLYLHAQELAPGHHRLNDFPTHLFTIWIAVATTAELVAYFVVQASNALARREQELEAMRARAARSERLVSLTTLAAGAAHELSTPLATIALAARELERAATKEATAPRFVDDVRLIRGEVDRCQAILDQMSGRAGGIAVDAPEPVDVRALIDDLAARLPPDRASRLEVRVLAALPPIDAPRAGLGQALLSLIGNAFDASPDGEPVVVSAEIINNETLRLTVTDRGPGIPPDILDRAGEPFYTTKEPGRGLGLGLFLARVFAERCGGSLALASNGGTAAILDLPLSQRIAEAAPNP